MVAWGHLAIEGCFEFVHFSIRSFGRPRLKQTDASIGGGCFHDAEWSINCGHDQGFGVLLGRG